MSRSDVSDQDGPTDDRPSRPARNDRGDSGDRGARRSGAGDQRPRRDDGGERRPRRFDSGDRGARRNGDGDRDGDRRPRSGGSTERPGRDGGGAGRPARDEGGFRPRRDGDGSSRPQRDDSGFRPRRDDSGGFRARRDDSGGFRPRRDGGDGPSRPRRDDRAGSRPRRDDGAGFRPRRDDGAGFRPRRDDDGGFRPRRDGERDQRPGAGDQRGGRRSTERAGRTPFSDRPARDGGRRELRPRDGDGGHRAGGGRHVDEPALPDDISASDLDRAARSELRTLTKENADAVARHLVAASRVIEDDPAEALRHALAAARRAGRVAVVRESVAIAAYATGDFALALRELRTFRRISGSDDQIALMVDSERGVGRPDRALEVGRAVDRASLPVEAQVGLAIAMSGARLDQGDASAALDELERAPIDLQRVHPWSPSLFDAFATVHEELGDESEAARWRTRAANAERVLDEVDAEQDEMTVRTEAIAEEPEQEPEPAPEAHREPDAAPDADT